MMQKLHPLALSFYEAEQEQVRSFFCQNPTPAHVEINNDDDTVIPIITAVNIPPPTSVAVASLPLEEEHYKSDKGYLLDL